MSNEYIRGMQITPLTMTICGVLWGVLFALGAWSLSQQTKANEKLSALMSAQVYDKQAIDEIKGDIRVNRNDIKVLSDRVSVVEARK